MRIYPELVAKLVTCHEAWIVGSAAKSENTDPRDYDILVPFSEWQKACNLIPINATPNTFGGWKCISENKEVDVWPGELGFILTKPMLKFAYHPATGARILKIN